MAGFYAQLARHKAQLYRLLMEILDDPQLAAGCYFKGGTCAAMCGFLDRFSVDLDFDLAPDQDQIVIEKRLLLVFEKLDLEIKDRSQKVLQFFLKYAVPPGERNTLQLDILPNKIGSNQYAQFYLMDVDRYAICQTQATLFANKLVAPLDRYERNSSIAGRDIYDIHHFFLQGYDFNHEVIEERRGKSSVDHLQELLLFVDKRVTQTVINQDLNVLLEPRKFQQIRKVLKSELIMFIKDAIQQA